MHSAKNAHQGRFAGAVLAHERVQLARQHIEFDVIESARRAEMLGNTTGAGRWNGHACGDSALHRHARDAHLIIGEPATVYNHVIVQRDRAIAHRHIIVALCSTLAAAL